MNGFIILGVFILFVFACFVSLITGITIGVKRAAADYEKALSARKETDSIYKKIKDDLKRKGK